MTDLNFSEHPHRRYNLLTGEWLQVSPHRAKRPWQGQEEEAAVEEKPEYDSECYLCPGNERAGGTTNSRYESTFVFTNDFASLKLDTPISEFGKKDLLLARGEPGICRVICFSPRHDLTLPEMNVSTIRNVVDVWIDEFQSLGEHETINYVQIFENKGQMMGASNPHPHGQIWAEHTVPVEPAKEMRQQRQYFVEHDRCLLCDYIQLEEEIGERVVLRNEHFIVLVPFWAVWPFETLVVNRRHMGRFPDLTDQEKDSLADITRRLTIKYDNLFHTSFPYSAGFHPAPTNGDDHPEWHFHQHYYPPLLRSASVKKFMVGFEMLANPQRDITAESAADRLRQLPETHFKNSAI